MHEERGRLVYQDDDGLLDLPAPRLARPPPVRQCRRRDRGAARRRGWKLPLRPTRPGSRKAEWPARMQRLSHGTLTRAGAGGQRTLARRRPQRRRRPRHRRGARRSRGARVAAAGADRRHAGDQGRGRASCAISPAWRAASSRCRSRDQEKTVPADAIADIARGVGIPAESRGSIEAALAARRASSGSTAAAHPDHRLALSRRRGAGRERHALPA